MGSKKSVERKNRMAFKRLIEGGEKGEDGQHVWGSSHFEQIALLRTLPVPPLAPGAGDDPYERSMVDPVAYRKDMNARKRARRARAGK